MSALSSHVQRLELGDRIELFDLDLSPIGENTVLRFTSSGDEAGAALSFGGSLYTAAPIHAEGFEVSGTGSPPQPKLLVGNVGNFAAAISSSRDDFVGALLTRRVTYRQFLDDGDTPDGTAFLPPEVYEIDRKEKQTALLIEWSLRALTDQEGKMLPALKVWKNYCTARYRVWDAAPESWNYAKATCPYQGAAMYTIAGASTTDPTKDIPTKDLKCCRLRFGTNAVLPIHAYPGVESY